jgi:peptidoglycan/xylan/chitin deacetylase (PgdA/CDA1 family)
MYHEIGPGESDLCIPPEIFRRQMDYLVRGGFRTISFAQLIAHLEEGAPLPVKPILLTFDDGYGSAYTEVYPTLKERGLTATFFINTGAVGLPGRVRWDQLLDLLREGFEIGSHTIVHKDLHTLKGGLPALVEELAGSRAILEERLGVRIVSFCYPAGNYNTTVVEQVRVAGYRAAVTTAPGRVRLDSDPLRLPRVRISQSNGYEGFVAIIGP